MKDFGYYKSIIQSAEEPYDREKSGRTGCEAVSRLRTAVIKKYFAKNAGLDLDAIRLSTKSTWEKAVELAVFVARNIPHDNQKVGLRKRNAITLWKYSKKVPTGFNCRWHAILLSELLLAAGIKNCFVTCLPEDKSDRDCHVVNLVWLPETERWAMIDSDMTEYVVDAEERPLSLREMRENLRDGREFFIRTLPGFEDAWVGTDDGQAFMKCYWAKNLYWFAKHTLYGYSLESAFHIKDTYICLVPKGYHYDTTKFNGIEVTNDAEFWEMDEKR